MIRKNSRTRLRILKNIQKALPNHTPSTEPYPILPAKKTKHSSLITTLEEAVTKAGGSFYLARDREKARQYVVTLAEKVSAQAIIREDSGLLQSLDLDRVLSNRGIATIDYAGDNVNKGNKGDWLLQTKKATLGITGIDYILADTGTIVISIPPGLSRSLSLLPLIHVAIGETRQLLDGLEALFLQEQERESGSAMILITGPSRTADIEQTLTTGVHGPIEFHLILLES
jgi:L-lactate utilization protein LutC